jgi:hypothetical protein
MLTEGAFKASLSQAIAKNYVVAVENICAEGSAAGYSIDIPLTRAGEKDYFRTALHDAVSMAKPEIAEVLLRLGACVDAVDAIGRTPLHTAVSWIESQKERMAVIEMLLAHGASGHAADRDGESILHRAMISHGQLVAKGSLGKMRVGLATDDEMLRLSRLLIAAGAQPDFVPADAKSRYRTAFQQAVKIGLVDQVRLFVEEYGVDWSQKTLSKKPMHAIAESDEMRALILSYKAGEKILGALDGDNVPAPSTSRSPLMAL